MRRTLPVLLALLSVPFAAPAEAVPPVVVTGYGTVTPFVMPPLLIDPVSLSFTGTATGVGGTFACSFLGSGWNVPPTAATGTIGQTNCGAVDLTGCVFELTPSLLTIDCAGPQGGQLLVQYSNVNPTTRFSVPSGVLL
ncbi:MAG TPA: hypothetical protein VF519_12395 [Mycobacteriales bacterium]|jgi:hypothetical protein